MENFVTRNLAIGDFGMGGGGHGQMEMQEGGLHEMRATKGRAGWTQGATRLCHMDNWENREIERGRWGGYPAGRGDE